MRNNLPVTQQEYEFGDDATLMSTTDTRSYITYANDAFIEVSGFTPEETNAVSYTHLTLPTKA